MAIKKVWSDDNNSEMWQADYRIKLPNGQHKRIRKLYHTKPAAEKAIRKDKVAAEAGTYKVEAKVTLGQWRDKVLAYVHARRHGTTPYHYERVLKDFVAFIGEARKIETLDRNDLRRYIDYLSVAGYFESTVKAYHSKLNAALNYAPLLFDSLLNWQPPNASFALLTLTNKAFATKTEKGRGRILSVDEIKRLLASLSAYPAVRDAVLCALNTGGRLQEILSLTWDRVVWQIPGKSYGFVSLKVTKVKGLPISYRRVAMTDELRSMLEERKKATGSSSFVFPRPDDLTKPIRTVRFIVMEACKRASIPYGQQGGFVFHDLRKTAVTYLRDAGINTELVCAITGHSPAVMAADYSKPDLDSQKKALDELAKNLGLGQLKDKATTGEGEENPPTQTIPLVAANG
jgi:integrase